jgi:hypothetical protein
MPTYQAQSKFRPWPSADAPATLSTSKSEERFMSKSLGGIGVDSPFLTTTLHRYVKLNYYVDFVPDVS